jgi:hypothetical protein
MTRDQPEPARSADRDIETRSRWTPVHRRTGSGSSWISLAALGVGLCAIVAGVSLAACSRPAGPSPADAAHRSAAAGSGPTAAPGGPDATARSTPPAGSAAEAAPAASAPSASGAAGSGLTRNGIASTAMRWPPGLEPRIQRWNTGPGGAALRTVTAQLGNTMQVAGVRLYPEVRQACVALGSSVETALAGPPIPYAAMQQAYDQVLAGLSGAVTECRNAISVRPEGDEDLGIDLNKALLNHSLAEFAAESNALYEATAEIRTLPSAS